MFTFSKPFSVFHISLITNILTILFEQKLKIKLFFYFIYSTIMSFYFTISVTKDFTKTLQPISSMDEYKYLFTNLLNITNLNLQHFNLQNYINFNFLNNFLFFLIILFFGFLLFEFNFTIICKKFSPKSFTFGESILISNIINICFLRLIDLSKNRNTLLLIDDISMIEAFIELFILITYFFGVTSYLFLKIFLNGKLNRNLFYFIYFCFYFLFCFYFIVKWTLQPTTVVDGLLQNNFTNNVTNNLNVTNNNFTINNNLTNCNNITQNNNILMDKLIINKHPMIWLFEFIFTKDIYHLYILIYWSICLLFTFLIMNYSKEIQETKSIQNKTINNHYIILFNNSNIKIPKIVYRKFFHLIAVVMFVPCSIERPLFMCLSYAIAICLFLLIESFRVQFILQHESNYFAKTLHFYLKQFTDSRDSGTFILTHIYLLIGCMLPTCVEIFSHETTINYHRLLSGVLILGIGDTMASVIGYYFGKRKWNYPKRTKKSIEGTCASIFFVCLISSIVVPTRFSKIELISYVFSTFCASMLEAYTEQIDNLILPIFFYTLLCAFATIHTFKSKLLPIIPKLVRVVQNAV
ncbi:hypothetical protein ABK040_006192 [Willaertia magna]